jgi:hypothetical protein
MAESWLSQPASPAAAEPEEAPRRGRRSGAGASLSFDDDADAAADVASTATPRDAAAVDDAGGGGGAGSSSSGASSGSRYVYGGALPSSERLNREAEEGERRWACPVKFFF